MTPPRVGETPTRLSPTPKKNYRSPALKGKEHRRQLFDEMEKSFEQAQEKKAEEEEEKEVEEEGEEKRGPPKKRRRRVAVRPGSRSTASLFAPSLTGRTPTKKNKKGEKRQKSTSQLLDGSSVFVSLPELLRSQQMQNVEAQVFISLQFSFLSCYFL